MTECTEHKIGGGKELCSKVVMLVGEQRDRRRQLKKTWQDKIAEVLIESLTIPLHQKPLWSSGMICHSYVNHT